MIRVPFEHMNAEFQKSYRLQDIDPALSFDVTTLPPDAFLAHKRYLIEHNMLAISMAISAYIREIADGYLSRKLITFDEYNQIIVEGQQYSMHEQSRLMIAFEMNPTPIKVYKQKTFRNEHFCTQIYSWISK